MSEKELYEEIGRRLKNERSKKGLTLVEVEVETGVSRSMINCIERGTRSPSIHTLHTLLTFYQIRYEIFFRKL